MHHNVQQDMNRHTAAEQSAVAVRRVTRNPEDAKEQHRVEQNQYAHTDHAELFADDREDKVGRGLRQTVLLDHPSAETGAEPAARTDGILAESHLEAAAVRIGIGVQPRLNARNLIGMQKRNLLVIVHGEEKEQCSRNRKPQMHPVVLYAEQRNQKDHGAE